MAQCFLLGQSMSPAAFYLRLQAIVHLGLPAFRQIPSLGFAYHPRPQTFLQVRPRALELPTALEGAVVLGGHLAAPLSALDLLPAAGPRRRVPLVAQLLVVEPAALPVPLGLESPAMITAGWMETPGGLHFLALFGPRTA